MSRLVALLGLLLLSACAGTVPASPLAPIVMTPPAELLSCRAAPMPQEGDYTQRDVAGYVLDLHATHSECHGRLGAVRRWVEAAGAGVDPIDGVLLTSEWSTDLLVMSIADLSPMDRIAYSARGAAEAMGVEYLTVLAEIRAGRLRARKGCAR